MFADGSDAGSVVTEQALERLVNNSVRVETVACAKNPKTFPAIATITGNAIILDRIPKGFSGNVAGDSFGQWGRLPSALLV